MFFRAWRCLIAKEARINHQIRAREVRVIGAQGEQLGVMPLHEALRQVDALGLDLVEVAPEAQPPVCRMMDYGKFRYQQRKKAHGPKKHTVVEIKEVKMGSRTDAHDVEHKVRNIRQFIEKGQRVKVSVFFRGREITHPELGRQMLRGVMDQITDIAKVDIEPRLEGRNMAMLLTPK
ncbi:MAG: translation initiation factor IF-3 [Candidatus Binatia bacterium]